MIPDIVDPKVLFVKFENQGGDWVITIPNAYKDGSAFTAPIDEDLSLQFQPVILNSFMNPNPIPGVACFPLQFHPEEDEERKDDDENTAPTS